MFFASYFDAPYEGRDLNEFFNKIANIKSIIYLKYKQSLKKLAFFYKIFNNIFFLNF